MIVAFCLVVAFKERIALMLGVDHKQIFNCKASWDQDAGHDALGCMTCLILCVH